MKRTTRIAIAAVATVAGLATAEKSGVQLANF